ncbi:hypothetical protein BGZ94_000160 [Podila epigama]|nr:hypothetical protein BGZ94_000160 [Podila epigama]
MSQQPSPTRPEDAARPHHKHHRSHQHHQPQQDLHVPHTHPEPTIGERFGRRHGQEWPERRGPGSSGNGGGRCASCPGSRSVSRGGLRRTSGVLYKVIPPRPVITARAFQAARKTDEEIALLKGKSQLQDFYRTQNELLDSFAEVEEVLRIHRLDEELNQAKGYLELNKQQTLSATANPITTTTAATNASTNTAGGSNGYGTISGGRMLTPTLTLEGGPTEVVIHSPNMMGRASSPYEEEGGSQCPSANGDEETPLFEYKKKQKTSPHLVQLAINVSFLANVFLVILKIWTVLLSDSLAVLASMIDSLMDLLSGAIIWYSARLRRSTTDGDRYPVGKARMEPLGIIVFASVMVTSFSQVMLQAVERLVSGSDEIVVDLGLIIMILLGLNILIKTLLWLWCRTMTDSASVQALAQDHLNDVVFNVFSTLFPLAGQYLDFWWLDATGAIILSIYIITEWVGTCLHNIRRLTGQAASSADIQQLTYMAYRFSNTIQAIDTVRAYSVGEGLFVEIDIVLPPDTPLSQAHDLGESLQGALERLDNVERAFVHIDYNAIHAIEHNTLKKVQGATNSDD